MLITSSLITRFTASVTRVSVSPPPTMYRRRARTCTCTRVLSHRHERPPAEIVTMCNNRSALAGERDRGGRDFRLEIGTIAIIFSITVAVWSRARAPRSRRRRAAALSAHFRREGYDLKGSKSPFKDYTNFCDPLYTRGPPPPPLWPQRRCCCGHLGRRLAFHR